MRDSENHKLDNQNIELLIDKKIASARFDAAEKRISFLLWFGGALLVIFGLIFPIYMSNRSDEKVEKAIEKMDTRFKELAGTQLRKPEIECMIDGQKLNGNVLRFTPKSITINRQGSETGGMLRGHIFICQIILKIFQGAGLTRRSAPTP